MNVGQIVALVGVAWLVFGILALAFVAGARRASRDLTVTKRARDGSEPSRAHVNP